MIISEKIVKAYAEEIKRIVTDKHFNNDYREVLEVCLYLSNNWTSPNDMSALLWDLIDSASILVGHPTFGTDKSNMLETLDCIINHKEVDLKG